MKRRLIVIRVKMSYNMRRIVALLYPKGVILSDQYLVNGMWALVFGRS